MFEVAFSRLMCCSRVVSVMTKARRPSWSLPMPTGGRAFAGGIALGWREIRHAVRRSSSGRRATCASPTTMSAPAGGLRIPIDTASQTFTRTVRHASAPLRRHHPWSSMVPKKFGDCNTTAATRSSRAFSSSLRFDPARFRVVDELDLDAEVPGVCCQDSAIFRMNGLCDQELASFCDALRHQNRFVKAVLPSYSEALATSIPVSCVM